MHPNTCPMGPCHMLLGAVEVTTNSYRMGSFLALNVFGANLGSVAICIVDPFQVQEVLNMRNGLNWIGKLCCALDRIDNI